MPPLSDKPKRSASTSKLRASHRPLPSPPTRFFGREDDLRRIEKSFATGTRLFTLLGPAGMGKTRLALRALEDRAVSDGRPRDVFCDLTDARHRADILRLAARALSTSLLEDNDAASSLGTTIARRGEAWIVFDNCEGCVDALGVLVATWMSQATKAQFLATSRVRLDVSGEQVLELEPLELSSAAVDLFRDRASLADAGAVAHDPDVVSAIVRRLDGIPLAIELAAARCAVLSSTELLARLDDRFGVLGKGNRNVATRQRTLHAAIEASWELLAVRERDALAKCSVFRGGFDLEAAQSVMALSAGDSLDALQALRHCSLLRVHSSPIATRYALYESIRAYATDRLAEQGPSVVSAMRARHATHFARVAPRWSAEWARRGDIDALERLANDAENVMEAHAFALAEARDSARCADEAMQLMNAIASLYLARGPIDVFQTALDRTLDATVVALASREAVAAVLLRRAYLHATRGRWAAGRDDVNIALSSARAVNDASLEASALRIRGTLERMAGNGLAARDALKQAVSVARRADDEALLSLTLLNMAQLDHFTGHLEAAREGLEEIRRIELRGEGRSSFGLLEHTLGGVLQELGDFAAARVEHENAVAIARRRDHRHYLGWFLLGDAQLEHETGAIESARVKYQEALEVIRPLGDLVALALTLGALAATEAQLSRSSDARRLLDEADAIVTSLSQQRLASTLSLFHGVVDLAGSHCDVEAARRRLFPTRDIAVASDEVRFAHRLLEAALAANDEHEKRATTKAENPQIEALVVAEDASWFKAHDGTTVELRGRPLLRKLLRALVVARIDGPGSIVTNEELARSGWPEERMLPSAAMNRVHVSLSRLRKLGLSAALKSADGGHFLDPFVPLRLDRSNTPNM